MKRTARVGGGRILGAVSRAVGGGVSVGSAPRGKPAMAVSVGSAPASPTAFSASASRGPFVCLVDGDEWERVAEEAEGGGEVGNIRGAGFGGFSERFVFGEPPSREEAESAVSTIQQVFVPGTFSYFTEDGYPSTPTEIPLDKVITSPNGPQGVYSSESESDWIEPAMHLYSSRASESHERRKVLDAFRLLQINPSVQRMVVSLSSDKAVWDAVMKNEAVQEFKKSIFEAENGESHSPDEGHSILKWILDSAKVKIMEFFDKITKLANEIFRSQEEKDKETDLLDDVLRSSFMLTIVVFITVVATRLRSA